MTNPLPGTSEDHPPPGGKPSEVEAGEEPASIPRLWAWTDSPSVPARDTNTGHIILMTVVYQILLVLFYVFLAVSLLANTIGLPGNWILIAAAFLFALATKFTTITWGYFFLCLGLALLGELIESILGTVVVAKKGGGRWGIVGSFLGGLIGVIGGSAVVPPLGSVVFGFIGAFSGAVLGEMVHYGDLDSALRIGGWAFLGRMMAMMGKISVGCVIFWIIVSKTWI